MSAARFTRSATIDLGQVLTSGTPRAIALWMEVIPDPAERAEQLKALDGVELARLGELLDTDTGEELFSTLEPHDAGDVLEAIDVGRAGRILDSCNSDTAADILRELAPDIRDRILGSVPIDHARVLRGLLSWPEDSAAAHMVVEVLTVDADLSAEEAVQQIRSSAARLRGDSQTGAYVYVTDEEQRLLGIVAFRSLVLAPAGSLVSELMDPEVISISPLDDPEIAARMLLDQRFLSLPVIDAEQRLLGILTADAAADIAEEEATEDAALQGGSQPLDVPYLRATPWMLWRKRIIWLLVLFVAEAYTGTVLRLFEDELQTVVSLAFFIPLLIGTGGNTGTQITTTIVRAMATGQVRMRDVGRVLGKEMATASMIAVAMAAAGVLRAFTLGVGWEVTATVSLSLAAIVLWAALIASVLPLTLRKTKIDPAVVSAPMIATIVDGTGLVIYFLIAKALLPQLAGM